MKRSLVVLTLCLAGTLMAQPQFGRRMGPGRGPMGMAAGMGKTVTDAPYSAVEVRESTQTLANGNVITHQTQTKIYRDSQGRVRTETTVPTRGRGAQNSGETTHTLVVIHDPVAGVTSELDSATKTARQTKFRGRGQGQNGAAASTTPRAGRGQNAQAATQNPNVVRENLAEQTVNGVQATGVRTTRTIPAGQMGNAQAIQSTHEVWTSPDLKVPVMEKDVDPRSGTHTTQLTNITRSEPDPSLFQTPSDYKVVAVHGRGGR